MILFILRLCILITGDQTGTEKYGISSVNAITDISKDKQGVCVDAVFNLNLVKTLNQLL